MTRVLAVLAMLVVCWFAVGTAWNVRKGTALMRWMQGGLPLFGERATVRWLGSTSIELAVARARSPFAQVALVVLLEPRDLPWLWWLSRRRGRRDTLILRAELKTPPVADLEVVDRASWSSREPLRQVAAEHWPVREPPARSALWAYYRSPAALTCADELLAVASRSGLAVRRLALRREPPHLLLHLDPPPEDASARGYFEALRALGERAAS